MSTTSVNGASFSTDANVQKQKMQVTDFQDFAKQSINIGSSSEQLMNFMKVAFTDERFSMVPAEVKTATIQTLTETRSQFYAAMSNALRSMFETMKNIISNMRV